MISTSVTLFKAILAASRNALKTVWASPRLAELTGPQFGILKILFERGPLAPTEISDLRLVSAGNVTGLITRLHRSKLVERKRLPSDRRRLRIALTAKGRETLLRLLPIMESAVDEHFKGLTESEKLQLLALLSKAGNLPPLKAIRTNQGDKESP